jgi:hypothetical protein
MAEITYPNKNTGDQVFASEMNEIKTVVNSNDGDLVSISDNGVLKLDKDNGGNIVYVSSINDFPASIGGVITLDVPDLIYRIIGIIDLSTDRIEITAERIKIVGQFAPIDQLISSVVGNPMIKVINAGFDCEKITLKAPTSTYIVDVMDDGTHNAAMQNVSIDGANTVLRVDNAVAVVVSSPSLWSNFDNGIILSGVIPSILISETLFTSFTGTAINMNGSTGLSVDISSNAAYLNTGSTFIELAPSGGNITSGGAGTISNNKAIELTPSTAITGYDTFETSWFVTSNTNNIKTSDRLEPNGWGFYSDDAVSVQNFTGTPSKLTINSLGSSTYEGKLPLSIRGLSSLWDSVDNKITPITLDDTYDLRINLEITSTNSNPTRFDVSLDIGGGATPTIVVAEDAKTLKTGSFPQSYVVSFPIFDRATFLANGGQIFISVDSGDIDISARSVLLVRTGSGAS